MASYNHLSEENGVSAERCFIHYVPPPMINHDGTFQLGAKEDWLERMEYFTENLTWLLQLNQKQFWKQLVSNSEIMPAVVSFLQEITPYYMLDTFPRDSEMLKMFEKANFIVFLVFNRLMTCKESPTETMDPTEVGKLLYRNYLITVPIMMDLCLTYGRDNQPRLSELLGQVFLMQPEYTEDLIRAIPYFVRVLRKVQQSFQAPVQAEMNGELKKLSERNGERDEITLIVLRDIIIHVLDTAATLHIFLDVYTPACLIFHDQLFESNIASFYENTFPEMYNKLETLANTPSTQNVYRDLRSMLDLARVEMLQTFRLILGSIVNSALEMSSTDASETKSLVDEYVLILTSNMTEKVFIRDYEIAHPIEHDLDILSQLSPEMDSTKCNYLIESLHACFDVPPVRVPRQANQSSVSQSANQPQANTKDLPASSSTSKKRVIGVELDSLISEVKDILPHLGEGYVQNCLEHYNYITEAVVNAVLEDTLPDSLRAMDFSMPRITIVEEEQLAEQVGRLNVFDNDEFDIMTQDVIDTSKVHRGKKKMDHKNLKDMIDDKTHRSEFRELYTKFGLVDTEGSLYDDEYDDTYDHVDVNVGEAGEQDRRAFVVPRVLRGLNKSSSEAEESGGEEAESAPRPEAATSSRSDFVPFTENPEEYRARTEQRRMDQRRTGQRHEQPQRDVVGAPKGHGQEKNVTVNRKNKTQRGNPNRRAGAARKRNQGMIPS